jgi:hypothetical protein
VFKEGQDPAAQVTALAVALATLSAEKAPGGILATNDDGTFAATVAVPDRMSIADAVIEAQKDPFVSAAEPDYAGSTPEGSASQPYADDHILVTFKNDKHPKDLIKALAIKLATLSAAKTPGGVIARFDDGTFVASVLTPRGMSVTDAITEALKDPTVISAEPDQYYYPDDPVTPGFYTITSKLDKNLVFDIDGASMLDGARVQSYSRNWTVAQVFQVIDNNDGTYTIKNPRSGKVLDVPGNNAVEGQQLHQYTPNGTDAQRWVLASSKGAFTLAPKSNPSLRVDVTGASKAPGTSLQLYRSNGTDAQLFAFGVNEQSILPQGTYKIACVNDIMQVVDVAGAASANGTNVQLYEDNGTKAQRFDVAFDEATGTYMFTSLAANKPLDVDGAQTTDGANVQVYSSNNTLAQRWRVELVGDRTYRVYAGCSGLALDAAGGTTANHTNVHTWTPNGTSAQVWVITKLA